MYEHDGQKQQEYNTMSTHAKNKYIVIFRGTDWFKGLSPDEMQQGIGKWTAWFKLLIEQNKASAGNPLESVCKIVSRENGQLVADGPFAEQQEGIAGYFFLTVSTLDKAVAIVKNWPGLSYGAKIELRPIARNFAARIGEQDCSHP